LWLAANDDGRRHAAGRQAKSHDDDHTHDVVVSSAAAMEAKSSSASDPEAQPLLQGAGSSPSYSDQVRRTTSNSDMTTPRPSKGGFLERMACTYSMKEGVDSTQYSVAGLSAWTMLLSCAGTVWVRKSMRQTALYLFLVSLTTGLLVLATCTSPDKLQVSKFAKLGTFLNVFVGLMLGFFLTSSMRRWYSCADGFMQIMDAIRNLHTQFMALGVAEDKQNDVLRYGILSVLLLELELQTEGMHHSQKEAHADAMWNKLAFVAPPTDSSFYYMLPDETDALGSVDDPAAVIWSWIAVMIGSMAQDGDIPAMQSPTYGRVMNLAQDAHGGIREVRTSISIQPAYIYVHLLASLVHLNNIINAVSFGLTWGATAGTFRMGLFPKVGEVPPTIGEVSRDFQNVVVSFFLSCFGPLIYQALLEVAITLSSPFSSEEGALPIRRQLNNLASDIIHSRELCDQLPKKWKKPCFKEIEKPRVASKTT